MYFTLIDCQPTLKADALSASHLSPTILSSGISFNPLVRQVPGFDEESIFHAVKRAELAAERLFFPQCYPESSTATHHIYAEDQPMPKSQGLLSKEDLSLDGILLTELRSGNRWEPSDVNLSSRMCGMDGITTRPDPIRYLEKKRSPPQIPNCLVSTHSMRSKDQKSRASLFTT
jgi:hypothetical protein